MLVTSGRFAAGAAACAFFDAGVGDAGAADALSVERFVDPDDATAAGACRPDDSGNTCCVQRVDQRDDRADRGEIPGTGEQFGLSFQRPSDPELMCGPRRKSADRAGNEVAVDSRIQRATTS